MSSNSHLVFALVGAVGAELSYAASALESELKTYGYKVNIIRLTDLLCEITEYKHLKKLKQGKEDERIAKLMDAGDSLRENNKAGEAVAALAIPEIKNWRSEFLLRIQMRPAFLEKFMEMRFF